MLAYTACQIVPPCSAKPIGFLDDARYNLRVMSRLYGTSSSPYRRLVQLYRVVANHLGCGQQLERYLHHLRHRRQRVSLRASTGPWQPATPIALLQAPQHMLRRTDG